MIETLGARRKEISDAMRGGKLLAIVGPCSVSEENIDQIRAEGERLRVLAGELGSLVLVHRMPVWKPRTNPADWHGLETTSPQLAHDILFDQSARGGNPAIEIAFSEHVQKYHDALAFAWTGSRNVDNCEQLINMAVAAPDLPIGVKNCLSGDIQSAVELAAEIDTKRSQLDVAVAPTAVIFRGGEQMRDPKTWQEGYEKAMALTARKLIVDIAHGSEMAHHPDGMYAKSVEGQVAAMESVIDMTKMGFTPRGIMIEASDGSSRTDPNMPLEVAVSGLQRLNSILSKKLML